MLSAQPVSIPFIPDDNQELSDAITRLAGHINAAQYRFLKLLAALIEREAWLGDSGMKSPAHWLNYYCGIDLGAAREKVRVAKCLVALPQIDEAFRSGAISYSKVRAMTRSATRDTEGHLLQMARHGTAQHVEKLVRKFERAKRLNDPQQEQGQHEARGFTWYYDDDGMLVFKGRLPAEDGAAFLKAMDAMLQSMVIKERMQDTQEDSIEAREERQQDDSLAKTAGDNPALAKNVSAEASFPEIAGPTFAQKRADALVAMADFAVSNFTASAKPATSADKYQVIVHIDATVRNTFLQKRANTQHAQWKATAAIFPWRPRQSSAWPAMLHSLLCSKTRREMYLMSAAKPAPFRHRFAARCTCATRAATFRVAAKPVSWMRITFITGAIAAKRGWIIWCCFAATITVCYIGRVMKS